MCWESLKEDAEVKTAIIIIPDGGGWTEEDGQPTKAPSTYATIEAIFSHLTSSELVARSQLQDNSAYKIYVEDTTENRNILYSYQVEIESIKYKITGQPKISPLNHGWITIYLEETE